MLSDPAEVEVIQIEDTAISSPNEEDQLVAMRTRASAACQGTTYMPDDGVYYAG